MKVVLFCGGLGTRLREYRENLPKPLVPIGYRPVLWHVMKYYAHFDHKDFVLCLGYRAEKIKEYFLKYDECLSNEFTLFEGGKSIALKRSDIDDWKITFVDTGLKSNIGTRLRQVAPYVAGEEMFLANYSDGLTDLRLPKMLEEFKKSNKIAAFVCAPPSQTFHIVKLNGGNGVVSIVPVRESGMLINGGYFIFRQEIFDYLQEGEDLVAEPFARLIEKDLVMGYTHGRFWSMDTFKEQQELTDLCLSGHAPWEVWRPPPNT